MAAVEPPLESAPIGVYIHIPFCVRKCPYCDFNTYAGLEDRWSDLVDALLTEIDAAGHGGEGRSVDTVFVGGGTPTVLAPEAIARLLEAVRGRFSVAPGTEISCEANPGATDADTFAGLRATGVNRLSIGVQSLDDAELSFLGRIHDRGDAVRAVEAARAAGFANLSLDLMFGTPGQERSSWRHTLESAVALRPEHLSLYSLIVEPGTPLADQVGSGAVATPDEDLAAEQYRDAMALLRGAGFEHYEVSNWARGGSSAANACRHNLRYWRNGEYIGFGPGAHSHLRAPRGSGGSGEARESGESGESGGSAGRRWANVKGVDEYIARVGSGESAVGFEERLTQRQSMGETMMLGLRLIEEGVTRDRFAARHGRDVADVFGAEISRLTELGLLRDDGVRLRLTDRGVLVGNQVFAEFVE